MINFKGYQYPKGVILYAVFFYVRYAVSYRTVDKNGKTLVFMLSEQRDAKATRRFFKQAMDTNDVPNKVVIDKSGVNLAGLLWTNVMFKFANGSKLIMILQVKYLNNLIEQDHRFIKKLTRPMMGFKPFRLASATLQGFDIAHMNRKRQFGITTQFAFQQFAALAE